MRQELEEAVPKAWLGLGEFGVWWTGLERVKIAREVRAARKCGLCRARKTALSPHTVPGNHDAATDLSLPAIEPFIASSPIPAACRKPGTSERRHPGWTDEAYVELLAVVSIVTAVDTFDRACGTPLRPLPDAMPGEPSRRRPAGAKPGLGWMPMLAPEDVTPHDPPLYSSAGRVGGNVHRALSLVPAAMMQFWDLFEMMYLPQDAMRDFAREYRSVSHAQIEMLAARVAVRNQCVY